ncbi:MAG: flippase-like domain-containing protein [Anaerolineales bacterium]|nr:flippase-like domain-containing protein [Anaerolineales bacterium]
MIAEEHRQRPSPPPSGKRRLFSWLNALLGIALLAWGLWYLAREITFADIGRALAGARLAPILLALLIMTLTQAAKAWRWQQLFHPREPRMTLAGAFWAVMLGQFVNTAVSFLRLGELARVFALHQQTGISRMRALGTLVLEKTLELITLALTILLLLPFVVVPDFMANRGAGLGLVALLGGAALYLLAYQTDLVIRLVAWPLRRLPAALADRLLRWSVAGLQGLSALRSPRALLWLLCSSAVIGLLSLLTPLLLFPALGLPFGLVEAALVHVVTTIASALPVPTPARLGVFEAAVMFMLGQLGLADEALALSYAILFHVVVLLPIILFGATAAARTRWRWRATAATWPDAPSP